MRLRSPRHRPKRQGSVRRGVMSKRLTEPFDLVEGDETGREAGERLIDVGASLVADGQATEAIEPGVGAFDHPAVAAELSLLSTPRRAMRGTIPRARHSCRRCLAS
jgi:hypothetical protein